MGKLVLLNDVSTEVDEAAFLVGCSDPVVSVLGKQQSEIISDFLYTKLENIDIIVSSDAVRLDSLIHKIRMKSKDQYLTRKDVKYLQGLRERDFGVLNRTQYPIEGSVFQHSRILPEGGESVSQCRLRLISCINDICKSGLTILAVSHPFSCQIISNVLLQKNHCLLTKFWQQKGSFVVFNFTPVKVGLIWSFCCAYNAFIDQPYTQDEIYSDILGK